MTYSLRDLMTQTLSLVGSMDVDDFESAERALDHLDVLISALLEHVKIEDTFVSWSLDDADANTVQVRENRGRVSRELLGLCERAAEVEVAIAERRAYRGELAQELYFAIADLCTSLSTVAPGLGLRPDELRAVA